MTQEKAISVIKDKIMWGKYTEGEIGEALDMAIQALENIGHLTDRPCSVCEFRKENGCCKWDCVFKGV